MKRHRSPFVPSALLLAALLAGCQPTRTVTLQLPMREELRVDAAVNDQEPFAIGQQPSSAAVLDLNLPLFERLVLAPEDVLEVTAELHVEAVEPSDAAERTVVTVHRLARPVAESGSGVLDDEQDPIASTGLVPSEDGWVRIEGLAEFVRRSLRGEAAAPGKLVIRARGPGRVTLTGVTPPDLTQYGRGEHFTLRKLPRMRVTVTAHEKHRLFESPVTWQPGVYCTMRDGNLYYHRRRLRLWGVCRHPSHDPNQVRRVKAMGFNAIRLWGPGGYSAASAKRGEIDPTVLDTYDRYVAAMKEEGMWIMCPILMRDPMGIRRHKASLLADDSWLATEHAGDDWEQWKAAVLQLGRNLRDVSYIDERLHLLRKRHAANFLNHVNPYTGKRYAEEEIIFMHELWNENGMIKWTLQSRDRDAFPQDSGLANWPEYFRRKLRRKWNAWLDRRYGGRDGLREAWGRLADDESPDDGSVAFAPLADQADAYPLQRAADLVRFLVETVDASNQDLRDHCRKQAPEGVGVAVVPFSFDTQFRGNLPWTYANSRGDVMCFGTYINRMDSALDEPPRLHNIDSMTTRNRATVLYEVNAGRPNPYRVEFPMHLAALGSWQDFDGIFWHYWQEPGADWKQTNTDEQYIVEPVWYKAPVQTEDLWLDTDPVMCTSMALAGQAFLRKSIDPAGDPLIYWLGKEAIFSHRYANGLDLAAQTFARGARLVFEPEEEYARINPPEHDAIAPEDARRAGEQLAWDDANGRLLIDTPTFKAYVGEPVERHRFSDGLTVSDMAGPFVCFAMVSTDGRPLVGEDGSRRILINAVWNAENTGMVMDTQGLTEGSVSPQEKARRIRSRGRAPVVYERVPFTVEFPRPVSYRFTGYDFALRRIADRSAHSQRTLHHDGEPLWMGVLEVDR